MAETLAGSVNIDVNFTHNNGLDLSSALDALSKIYNIEFTNGTGANKVKQIFHDKRTIAASSTDTLDLAGGLTNVYGTTITFTKIKGIIVFAAAANTNNVHVQCPSSNGFVTWCLAASDGIKLQPGSVFTYVDPAGVVVTAGTGDLLDIINSAGGTSVDYEIVIFGETA